MSWAVCSFCGHDNPLGSNYCNDCGEDLKFTLCGRCEAINPHTASHCYKCGSLLSEPSPGNAASTNAVENGNLTTTERRLAQQTTAEAMVAPSEPRHRWYPALFVALFSIAVAAGAVYYLQSAKNPPQPIAVSADPSPALQAHETLKRQDVDTDSLRNGEPADASVSDRATEMTPPGSPPLNGVAEPTGVSETDTSAAVPGMSGARQAEQAAIRSTDRNIGKTASRKSSKRPAPGAAKREASPAVGAIAPPSTRPNRDPQPSRECSNAVAALGLCSPGKANAAFTDTFGDARARSP